jgi:glycosyltransferase involved in cell wall biosynthesis
MQRIAHLTADIDGRSNSGTARVARELISELSQYPDIFQSFVHFQKGGEEIYNLPRSNEIVIPLGSNWLSKRRSISFLRWVLANRFSENRLSFDIVHWHSSRLYPFFFLFPGKKTVITLHDVGQRILPNVNTFATRIHYWNARLFQSKIHRIIAGSETAMKDLEVIGRFRKSKLDFVYYGTNFGNLAGEPIPGVALPNKFVVCVSRWQPHKNVAILVQAVNEMRLFLEEEEVSLILVGKPVGEYNLPGRLITNYELNSRIIVLSDLTDQNMAFLYDRALLNIFPSIHEGFGLSVLEGMTRGCVPLVHSQTSTSEIAGNAGLTADMNNLESVVNEFRKVLSNPSLWEFKKELAIKLSSYYTWPQAATKLRNIYSQVD